MKKTGFTLGELLIVLAILGVLFAMTIPKLLAGSEDAESRARYKKAFQNIAETWALSVNLARPIGPEYNRFRDQTRTIKICITSNAASCWQNTVEKVDGTINNVFVDRAGMAWAQNTLSSNHFMQVDTNGFGGPNLFGRDRFIFRINGARIQPLPDYPASHTFCPQGNCFYTTWLDQ